MPSFQDDLIKQFDQGVADIEGEKVRKKKEPLATPGAVSKEKSPKAEIPDWLGESFASGVEEIESSRIKETHLIPAVGRAAATIPPHIARAGAGLVQRGAERWEGKREEVRGALETIRGVEPERVKKETKPLTYGEDFGTFVLDLLGKGVEKVGEGIKAISETAPVKAYEKFRAESRLAEAMVGGELKPEVMKLVKAGDEKSLAQAAELLKKDEGFYQSWLSKKAEEGIARPVQEAAMKGGKALGKAIEKIRPTTRRGSYKYFVTAAIEGVGSTMGPALAVSIATKNPGLGMAVMFPQVFGEVYSETRVSGEGVLESSQKAMFYAASEVLSEGLPLGILTKRGGRLITEIFKGTSAEGVQEAVNEATQIAYDEGIIDEHTPHHEIGRRLIEAGIIGAIGGGGMAVGAHAFTGKEEDATAKLKKDVLDGITETYDKGELDTGKAIDSVMEGYKSGLFDDSVLDGLSKKYPELKNGIEAGKVTAKTALVKEQLSAAVDEGLTTGRLQGEEFTPGHAMDFIRNGRANDIFTNEDLDEFKEKYPDLRHELNDLIAENVTADIVGYDEFEFEPVTTAIPEKAEKPVDEYAIKDIEETYIKAKDRARREPLTLHELQERFKERHKREATAKEQENIKRLYERAKKRAQRGKIIEKKEPEAKDEKLRSESIGSMKKRAGKDYEDYEKIKDERVAAAKRVALSLKSGDKVTTGDLTLTIASVMQHRDGTVGIVFEEGGGIVDEKLLLPAEGETVAGGTFIDIPEIQRKEGITPKTEEELEYEKYEGPALPPGVAEVRTKEGQRTYPRGVDFIAGKAAPEDLKVEYKPIQKQVGKKTSPWITLSGARNALESDKMKDAGVSPATHKVVETKGGYQIVPIKAKGEPMAREVKEEVKGKTLLSWVRAMGGVKDKTLPGEIRALSAKEAGVVGLTTTRPEMGLGFDEMASAAVEEGWIAKSEDFSEILRDDIFAQKEKKPRAERLADVAARTEREERWKEFDRSEEDMLKYFAEHPDEEIDADLDKWQREAITDIRRRDAERAKEIEESARREVEEEDPDLEGLKDDEGFSEFIEGWDEREALDEETLAELDAWRAEQKVEPVEPEAPKLIETKYRKRLEELKAKMGEKAYFDEGLNELYKKEPQEILSAYRKLHPEGAGVLYQEEGDLGVTISPSAKKPGRWQTTWFDAKGFTGDTNYATEAEAFVESYREGYRLPDPERGKKQMISPEFVEGIAKVEAARKEWKKVDKKEAVSHIELVKRYVEETGEKVEKGELDKVKEKYPEEWTKIEKAEAHKKELWDKLPESFRRNRGINEYTVEELEAMVVEKPKEPVAEAPAKEPWEMTFREWQKAPLIEGQGSYWAEFNRAIMAKATFKEAKGASLKQALKSGKLTPEKYAELHEKDYGPLAEFMLEAKKVAVKEPWETSDLADRPNISINRVTAKKQPDGKYKLFYTGTLNEVFEGETFVSAPEARSFFKVQQVKAQEAAAKKVKPEPKKKVVGQRSRGEGVEFYNPFNVKTRNKIIEGKPNFAGVIRQGYRDGFFAQGHYAVRLPEAPKTKGPLSVGEEANDVKSLIPTEDMASAYLIGEFKPGDSEHTFAHAMAPGNQDCFFNADYVDIILTRYPDAKLSFGPMVYEGRLGVFTVGDDVVGLVMSARVDVSELLEKIQQTKTRDDVKFSVAEEKDLVAYHNLTGQNLIDADELGGMPMPSLAITKKDFPYEPFGDITMVGSKEMVDPEGTLNRVFDADTYSPTVPGKERDLKRKPFDELWIKLSGKISDVGDYSFSLSEAAEKGYDSLLHFFDNSNGMKVAFLREQGIPIRIPMRDIGFEMPFSDTKAVQDFVKSYKGNIWDIKLHSPEHKALSVAVEKGVDEALERDHADEPEYAKASREIVMDTWFDKEGYAAWGLTVQRLERDAKLILKPGKEVDKSALRESLEKKFTKKVTADYLEWTKKQIDPLYGDPFLKLGRKKVPYTLSNVFEAMHRQSIRSSQDLMTFGPGKARAMGVKEFPTLAAVRKHKAALVSHDKFEKLIEKQDKKRESLTDGLARYYQYKDWRGEVDVWNSIDDSMKAIGAFLKSPTYKQTPGQMRACLGRRGFKNVPAYTLKDTVEFAKTLRDMPTEYFEVKPERIVNIGEFSGAALPRNVDPKVKEILKKHGVPFKIYKTEEERQAVTASFQRKQGVLFSEVAGTYSALTRAAESPKFPAKLPAKSVINQLKKASGVKQVEIDTSGLSEWLEGKDKVTKAELVDFLRMNEILVEEVEKGITKAKSPPEWRKYLIDNMYLSKKEADAMTDNEIAGVAAEEMEAGNIKKKDVSPTKFAEHVLPGGEPGTYRELVLRVPDRYQAFPAFPEWAGMTEAEFYELSEEKREEMRERYFAEGEKLIDERYQSGHWDEPNVVAHIRGDIRIGSDGKKRFHVAEFQSDIYSRIVELEAEVEAGEPSAPMWQLFYADGTAIGGTYGVKEHAEGDLDAMNEGRTTSLLTLKEVEPLRDTKASEELANLKKLFPWGEMWHEFVAKKALEYAVKNDLDGISWDTAKTQVDRWESALRKSVDKIKWGKDKKNAYIAGIKNGEQNFAREIPLQGETTISGQRVTLNNLIGKELATKIRESSENEGSFEGKDLVIGGEFYKIIYDQKIPGFLKKYGKKWGAKVGMGEVGAVPGDDYHGWNERYPGRESENPYTRPTPVHAMDLTPDMREAIQTSGQALFAEGAAPGKKLTVDTAKTEIVDRIGKKALNAMIRAKKVQLVTLNEAADIIGYARESKDQGFFKDGIVYIIPENIAVGHAWGVLMHELGVHLGYNKIFGEKLAKEVFAAFVANNGKMNPLGRAVSKAMRRVPYGTRPDLINEEAVAYFTEEHANIDLPLHRKIIARMRLWAVKYFGVKPDIFVMEDYVALASSAMRGEIREAHKAPVREGVSREAFYSVAEQKDLRAWADDLIKGAKDSGVVLDKETPSPERLKETSVSILAGLDLKKLNQPARSFLEGMSPKGKGLGAFVEKWLASPEWYQHPVLKEIVGHSLNKSEKFHTLFNEFNAVDDPMAEHDTVAKTLEALARKGKISKAAFIIGRTSSDFKKLETLLDDADIYGEKHTVEGLKEKGYSEDVIHAWSVVRESYDKQLEARLKPMRDLVARIKEQAVLNGIDPKDVEYPDFGEYIVDGKKRRLNLKEATMYMGQLKGTYSPRMRSRGDWVVTGKKVGTVVEGGDDWFRDNRRSKSFANLLRDDLVRQGYTDVKVQKESRLPEETFQAVRLAEMGTVIGEAAKKGLDKYNVEQQMAFMDDVMLAASDTLKSRGSRSIMIRRRGGKAVLGYITNPLIRFVRYTGNNAAGIAKAEMAEKMIKSLYGEYRDGKKHGGLDAAKEGEIHSLARAYIEEQLRNAEAGDRIVGVMKGLCTLKFLGFNLRSILVNISSLTTSVPVSLHTYILDGKGSLLRIGKVLSRSCKDYTMVMAGKRLKNTDEQIFINAFRDAGYTDAQYTRDAMGNIQGAYGTAWSKLMGGSMYAFGKSEEWVRGGTALAAYRLARKKGLSHTEASEKAIFATSKAHGTYGKETLPMVAWGKGVGRLGQAFYTYLKFPHNYLQMLYDSGIRKKNIKGVIFGLAAPAVLGGVAAVPMYSTIMAIANVLMSLIGDDRDAEKLVYDTINEHMGKAGEETIRGGILGLVDVDITGSLSMGPGAIPTSLFELTGAVGGMVEDIGRGAQFAIEGEYGRAAEKLLPKALGNVFTAIREIEGATTRRGDRVWDEQGNPYMPAPSETAKKALGFRSARRALLAQSTWVAKREERRFKETQSDIYKKIKYMTAESESIIIDKEVADKISEYNKNVLKTSNVPLITPASIERQMERMKAPTTKQKARVTGAERVHRLEGDIWADALGVADRPDRIQVEVKRLTNLHMLSYSADPSRKINAGHGVEVTLDDDQYGRYITDTSAMIRELVDLIMSRPNWMGLSDKRKAFAIKRMINKGRKIVRDRLKKTILRARLRNR